MRILEVCVDLDGGGIDRYLFNYCSRIHEIQFDFAIIDNNKTGILEPELEALGCRIYRVPRQSAGMIENYRALKRIFTDNHYDAVHVHLGYKGAVALLCAKNCGVKTRIVHAHIAYETENFTQKCLRKVFTVLTKAFATHLAACGIDAAKWVWGEKTYQKGKVKIHNNAIDTEKFRFREDVRCEMRKILDLEENTLAIGHVGRISYQKNQKRLLDIFAQIRRKKVDSKLFLIGRGEEEEELKQKAQQLGIAEHVVFLGIRSDVHELLNAFDVFVFPSRFEGLPFTLIETQCNGLMAISADTVTDQVKLGEGIVFLSLDDADEVWADKAIELGEKGHIANGTETVVEAGYDINCEAKKLKRFYIDQVSKA